MSADDSSGEDPQAIGISSQGVDDYLEGKVNANLIAGAVGLVYHQGNKVYHSAVGMRDVEAEKPMRKKTLFRIASMTKPITSTAAMILVEEGAIALNAPVSDYLPEFANVQVCVEDPTEPDGCRYEPPSTPITIKHLFTHTSGLGYAFGDFSAVGNKYRAAGIEDGVCEAEITQAQNIQTLASQPLHSHPGTAYRYGLSIDVLGRVVEVVSQQTLPEFLYERIFEPLEMHDTYFRVPVQDEDRLAALYEPDLQGDFTIRRLPEGIVEQFGGRYSASYPLDRDSEFFSGGAGLVSTASDYTRFLRMIANGGVLGGVRILQQSTVEQMTQSQTGAVVVDAVAGGDGFGLGFATVSENVSSQIWHSPGSYYWGGHFQTFFWVDPQEEVIGIVMTQLTPWAHMNFFQEFRAAVYTALGE